MRNKLDYKILLGSSVCQLVKWGFEPYHTAMGWKMTRAGQAECLVVGPRSVPGSAVDLGDGVCVLLTNSSVLQVWDQSCIFKKALLSTHRGLDDFFRDEATYFEIITKPRAYNFSVLVFVLQLCGSESICISWEILAARCCNAGHLLWVRGLTLFISSVSSVEESMLLQKCGAVGKDCS